MHHHRLPARFAFGDTWGAGGPVICIPWYAGAADAGAGVVRELRLNPRPVCGTRVLPANYRLSGERPVGWQLEFLAGGGVGIVGVGIFRVGGELDGDAGIGDGLDEGGEVGALVGGVGLGVALGLVVGDPGFAQVAEGDDFCGGDAGEGVGVELGEDGFGVLLQQRTARVEFLTEVVVGQLLGGGCISAWRRPALPGRQCLAARTDSPKKSS